MSEITFCSEKDPLPKGMSYPLKPSFLAQALVEAGITIDSYLGRRNSSPYFRASYLLPNPNVPYERLYMTVGAVPSAQAHSVREQMENKIIPEMILWMRNILSSPHNSPVRREKQEFTRFLAK